MIQKRGALKEKLPDSLDGNDVIESDEETHHFVSTKGRSGDEINPMMQQAVTWDKPEQF